MRIRLPVEGRPNPTPPLLAESSTVLVSPLIIHERKGHWGRQLRPRVASWAVRPIETRSAEDLRSAARFHPFPLAVFDLGERPLSMLSDLDVFLDAAPGSLTLALDPTNHSEVAEIAWERGATFVLSGFARPPVVVELLTHWLTLSRRRAESDGWFPSDKTEEDDPYLGFASPGPLLSSFRL